jgi:hypothetical protein
MAPKGRDASGWKMGNGGVGFGPTLEWSGSCHFGEKFVLIFYYPLQEHAKIKIVDLYS